MKCQTLQHFGGGNIGINLWEDNRQYEKLTYENNSVRSFSSDFRNL